jgi:hypothetical protein
VTAVHDLTHGAWFLLHGFALITGTGVLFGVIHGISEWVISRRKRSPLRSPVPGDGEPLNEAEQRVFNGYVVAEQRGHPLADEPQARRQP